MPYQHIFQGQRWQFDGLRDVMAKATPLRSGDALAGVGAASAAERMAARMAKGVPQANGEIAVEPLMDVNIVGQSVLYMANLPPEANVLFHTVMASKMPFVERG